MLHTSVVGLIECINKISLANEQYRNVIDVMNKS